MEARIERALKQRLYLISQQDEYNYYVSGLTSKYHVCMKENTGKHTCTCPDYKHRRQNCKHIFFVLFRVLKINRSHWLQDQKLLKRKARPEVQDTVCAICYEDLEEKAELCVCDTCGHGVHAQCFKIYAQHTSDPRCPLCRSVMNPEDTEELPSHQQKGKRRRL
jgi:hypothetical protein